MASGLVIALVIQIPVVSAMDPKKCFQKGFTMIFFFLPKGARNVLIGNKHGHLSFCKNKNVLRIEGIPITYQPSPLTDQNCKVFLCFFSKFYLASVPSEDGTQG